MLTFSHEHPAATAGPNEVPAGPAMSEDPNILHHALAYIDPGSGSLIIQAVIAGAAGAVFMLRNQIRRVAGTLRRLVGAGDGHPKE
jgi:hypothetical protein